MAFGKIKIDQIESSTQVINVDDIGLSSGVSDGNKGDITVSSGGTVWSVNDGAVALNKLSDVTLTSPSDGQSLSYNASTGQWVNSTPAGSGTVTSVGLVVPAGFSVSGSPVTTSGNITLSFAAGYSLPTTASQANWDTAYSERLYWDGGATGLNASTGRTSLGLGNSATLNVGTTAGTVAAGDDNRFVPAGGTTGQALIKSSGTDYDASWSDLPARTTTAAGVLPATSYAAITYATTVNLDLAALDGQYRTISLTGDLTLTASNLAAGRTTVIRIIADASQRTLTFPADWKFLGTKPANIAASKTGVLSLTFFGTADSDCVAAWGVQG